MTERQRLITKYTQRLYMATNARYQLHFLRNETDESAKSMILDTLNKMIKDTNNETLQAALSNVLKNSKADIKFGQHTKNKQKIPKDMQDGHRMGGSKDKDYKQTGSYQYLSLYLEDALKSFSKYIEECRSKTGTVSYADKMYKERTEINLVFGNYAEALSLSQKGNLPDMAFVAAIAKGDFETAKQYIEPNLQTVVRNIQEKQLIASTFEMIHLISFVLFATSTSTETQRITDQLYSSTNYELNELRAWRDAFCQRNFAAVLKNLSAMKKVFELSIYTSPVIQELSNAIIQNVIVLTLFPLARAQISTLCNDLGLSAPDIISFIQKSIRQRKLNGKLDLTSNTYNSNIIVDNEYYKTRDYFNQITDIRQKFQLNLWVKEYNATVKRK